MPVTSLTAIASYNANVKQSDFIDELGELYYGRMLRGTGIKTYEAQRSKIVDETTPAQETKNVNVCAA